MEFSNRRATAWMITVLVILSIPLVLNFATGHVYSNIRTIFAGDDSKNLLFIDIFTVIATWGGVITLYVGFIKLYWKPYYGLANDDWSNHSSNSGLSNDLDSRQSLYDHLSRRRQAR